MKKTAKFLVILLAILMVASTVSTFALGEFKSEAAIYEEYGYYTYFDFENYSHANHLAYFRSSSTNADNKLCDPAGFVLTSQGNYFGNGTLVTEGDNSYYHFVQGGAGANYAVMAVFDTIDKEGKDVLLGDAIELSFKFRLSGEQTEAEDKKMALVNVRRNGDNIPYLASDIYGNLYIQVSSGNYQKIYTNSGDGEFMDISFRWYDVTNTFSVYVNGEAAADSIPFYADYRNNSKVIKTYDDDFQLESMAVAGGTGEGATRTIEFIRQWNNDDAFVFDVDDIKLSRIETAQGGAVYYDNSFDGTCEGISLLKDNGVYFYNGTPAAGAIKVGAENADGHLEVASGQYIGFNDKFYQAYTQNSLVIEFSVKGTPTQASGRKAIFRLNDSYCATMHKALFVDQSGNLYMEDTDVSRIEGYKLTNDEWLDVAIVIVRNDDNDGKFGSFDASTKYSKINYTFTYAYYINGNFVGISSVKDIKKFSKSSYSEKLITTSGFTYTITDHNTTLDLSGLTLVDGTSTEGHKIYKSVVDGVTTYYDVNFDENGNQTKYSAMVLGSFSVDDENIRFFTDACFNAKLDDLRIYEGTAPEYVYAGANSEKEATVLKVDFSKFTFPKDNVTSRTRSSGPDVLGSFMTSGVQASHVVRKDANGNAVSASNTTDTDYATINMVGGAWFDYFVPMPKQTNGGFDFTYSFETKVKNFTFGDENAPTLVDFFSLRLENEAGFTPQTLLSVDSDLFLHITSNGAKLYDADGMAVKLDNENWNTLRVDVHFSKSGNSGALDASYYLNGQPLYFEDGSAAMGVASIFGSTLVQKVGVDNVRLRYIPQVASKKNIYIDVKDFTISTKPGYTYSEVEAEQADFGANVTAIEFTIPKYNSDALAGRYEALALVKGENKLPLIVVDPATSKAYLGLGGQYYELLDREGNVITVPAEGLSMAVVYNDVDGLARYYANGAPAFVELGTGLTMAAEIGIYDASFAQAVGTGKYVVFNGFADDENALCEDDYNLVTYNLGKKDSARIIGFQKNEDNNDIRLIAGVNSLYYSSVGFEIEGFENGVSGGVKDVVGYDVFESIVSNGEKVTAADLGYKYLVAFAVSNLPSEVEADSYILIRAFTAVGDEKHYDDMMKLVLTSNGYYFDKDGTVYQNNFNGMKALPAEWKLEGNSTHIANGKMSAALTAKGEVEFNVTEPDKAFLYLDQYVGDNYLFQFDFTVTDYLDAASYIAPTFGYKDFSHFGYAYIRMGDYSTKDAQGKIQANNGGAWTTPEGGAFTTAQFGSLFEEGKLYTITLTVNNGTVALFVDGRFIAECAFDGNITDGRLGICAKGASILVDNVIVKTSDFVDGGYFNYAKSFVNENALPTEWTAVDTHANGTISVASENGLKLTATGDQLLMVYLNKDLTDKNGATVSDYVVETDIVITNWESVGRYFGLTFRQNGGENKDFVLAALRIYGKGWIEGNNKSANSYSSIVLPSYVNDSTAVFTKGQTVKLKLEVEGDTAKLYLDGQLISTGTKPSSSGTKYSTGTVGVASKGVSYDVKKFTVTTLGDNPEILFTDDFTSTDYTTDWTVFSTDSARHSVTLAEKSGALAINEKGTTTFIHAILDPQKVVFDDYTVSADTTITESGNYYGLLARYTNNGGKNYAIAYVRNTGKGAIEFMSPSGWVSGYAYNFDLGTALTKGTVYNLKVTCEGDQIAFYINNVKVAEGAIPAGFETGTVGVGAKGICIDVDNFKVSKDIKLYEIKDAENPTTRIKVATFNIGDFSTASGTANLGIDKGNGTDKTKQEYIDVFKKVGADIWGLQEDSQYFNGDSKETPFDAIYSEALPYYQRKFSGTYNGKAFASNFEIYDVEQVYYNKVVTSYAPNGTTDYGHKWFLAGKVMVEGKEITLITLHFDWACKERRFQQIRDVIAYAQKCEYAIILGDFNPENYVNGNQVADPNDEHYVNGSNYVNMYQVDWKFFTDAGFEPANGGRFGAYETLVRNGKPRGGFPWDSVFVSSNIKITNAYPVYESWMNDHAIFVAELELN